jgi:hypothetical protein
MSKPTENPLESVHDAIVFDVIDWTTTKRMAWIWGVVCGWDEESMAELVRKYHWDADTVARLERLHKRWDELLGEVGE